MSKRYWILSVVCLLAIFQGACSVENVSIQTLETVAPLSPLLAEPSPTSAKSPEFDPEPTYDVMPLNSRIVVNDELAYGGKTYRICSYSLRTDRDSTDLHMILLKDDFIYEIPDVEAKGINVDGSSDVELELIMLNDRPFISIKYTHWSSAGPYWHEKLHLFDINEAWWIDVPFDPDIELDKRNYSVRVDGNTFAIDKNTFNKLVEGNTYQGESHSEHWIINVEWDADKLVIHHNAAEWISPTSEGYNRVGLEYYCTYSFNSKNSQLECVDFKVGEDTGYYIS